MKKAICFILLLVMMLFSGCTALKNPVTTSDTSPESTIAPLPSKQSVKSNVFTLSSDRNVIKKYSEAGELIKDYQTTGLEGVSYAVLDQSNGILFYTAQTQDAPGKNEFTMYAMNVSSDQQESVPVVQGIEARIRLHDGVIYYWINGKGIFKYDIETKNTGCELEVSNNIIYDFDSNGEYLYYSVFEPENQDLSGFYLYNRTNKTTKKIENCNVSIIGLGGDNCIYSNNNGNKDLLYRYDGAAEKSTLIPTRATNSVVYGDKILYANPEDAYHIYQMDLNGSNKKCVADKSGITLSMCNEWIYFTPYSDYQSYCRYSLETGKIETMPETFFGEIICSGT